MEYVGPSTLEKEWRFDFDYEVALDETYTKFMEGLKEKKSPGYYFAPGCCRHPDYVIQVPVLFEDGTYDVMRAMNIKKTAGLPEEKRSYLLKLIDDQIG